MFNLSIFKLPWSQKVSLRNGQLYCNKSIFPHLHETVHSAFLHSLVWYEILHSTFLDTFSTPGTFFGRMNILIEKLYWWFDGVLSWFMVNCVECSIESWETGLRTGLQCCVGGLLKWL